MKTNNLPYNPKKLYLSACKLVYSSTRQLVNLSTCLLICCLFAVNGIFAQTDFSVQLTDDELLTKVQRHTFKYFWDYAPTNSGMMTERLSVTKNPTERVTTGGSGFGVMAILVGIERGFITREQGLERLNRICDFLLYTATNYKGAFAHWINGNTGETLRFSPEDNGGDLVETSFMIQGLLAARQYFAGNDIQEKSLREKINQIWHRVDWQYFTFGENSLHWHCNDELQNVKDLEIKGFNECMITYILAIASPTYPVNVSLWQTGWSPYKNRNKVFYGITLPTTNNVAAKGGPLFLSHYSFVGFNPKNLRDTHNDINYFEQCRAHTLINRAYCEENPLGYVGYGADKAWGLTACDGYKGADAVNGGGYSAHSPNNDRGNIAPTAAISSMPFTPEESMAALRHFYYTLGPKIWNDKCGFVDSFNETKDWVNGDYLSIDQGPIICMIENYRTGLLWNLFMSAPEIQDALQKIGFVNEAPIPSDIKTIKTDIADLSVIQEAGKNTVNLDLKKNADVHLILRDINGRQIDSLYRGNLSMGEHHFNCKTITKGFYIIDAMINNARFGTKIIL